VRTIKLKTLILNGPKYREAYNPEAFLEYPTWILPTVLINDHVVARGYAPDIKTMHKRLL